MRALHKRLKEEKLNIISRAVDFKAGEESTVEYRVNRLKEMQRTNNLKTIAVMYTTIHKAASDGNTEGIKHFLKSHKHHIEDYDARGWSAIHYAAEKGHLDAVELILKKECEVDLPCGDGTTAVMNACKGGHLSVIKCLHQHGANLFIQNRAGLTAAHCACQEDQGSVLKLLIELLEEDKKFLIENKDRIIEQRDSPYSLLAAAKNSGKENVELTPHQQFLEKSIRVGLYHHVSLDQFISSETNLVVNVMSNSGMTPLHLAASVDAREVVSVLLESGVEPNLLDSAGESALHKAGRQNNFFIYRLLVSNGAQEYTMNLMKETPAGLLKDDAHAY